MAHMSSPILLLPLNPEAGLDVLSIDTLPCIVGRAEEAMLSEYAQKFPDLLKKISRKHARLFAQEGTCFIQDLGSTNGTTLAGAELDAEAKPLQDGDTIAFSDFFSYRVQLPPTPRKRSLAEALAAIKANHGGDDASDADATKPPPVPPPAADRQEGPIPPLEVTRDNADPSKFDRLVDAGQNRFREGDFEAAFDAYQKALELRSDALDIKKRLHDTQTELKFATLLKSADGLLDAGRVDECRATLEAAGRIKPEDEALEWRLKKTQELESLADRVSALCAEAEHHSESGAFATAIERYREALALTPENTDLKARIDALEKRWQEHEAHQASGESDGPSLKDQTILIDDSTQFLKAFSHPREAEPPPQEGEVDAGAAHDPTADASADSHKKPSVLRAVLDTFFAGQKRSPRRKWMVLTLAPLGVLLAVLALVMLLSPERKLENLISEGDFASAMRYAERELAKDPGDEGLNRLATQALMGGVISPWSKQLLDGRFMDAQAILDDAAPSTRNHPEGERLLGLLNWILAAERFGHNQEAGFKLVIFRDETPIAEMLQEWEANESHYRPLLDQIPARYPTFEDVRKRAYSRLSRLKAMTTTEIAAIQTLVEAFGVTLDGNRSETLNKRLDDFERRFPGVGGTGRLRADLSHYNRLRDAVAAKQVFAISRLLETHQFSTPPFASKVDELRDTVLPSAEILAAHASAGEAWRSGEGAAAIAILTPLTGRPWGEVAAKSVARYQDILKQLAELEAKTGQTDYGLMVLKLYGQLQPGDDDYYIDALETKAGHIREKELTRAETLFEGAAAFWRQYLESDSITGYLRLQGRVSPAYRRQAKRLNAAAEKAGLGRTIYRLLKLDVPKRWAALSEKITSEAEIQRIRLEGLKGVLPPEVFERKSALLPES